MFDGNPTTDESPTPATAQQALRFSATAAVTEGIVACWGMGGVVSRLPATDVIGTSDVPVCQTIAGASAVGAIVRELTGEGRIYGKTSADGTIEFAFKVIVNKAPDQILRPGFRFVPSSGSLTVGRWYFSDPDGVRGWRTSRRA